MTSHKAIDFAVLKKFNSQGPRYTSYPTAPMFSPKFTDEDFVGEIRDTNQEGSTRPLSLYFHFPFCAKLCYFCGCNMKVSNDRAVIDEYNRYIKREMDAVAPMIAASREVTQMHWGGGTPSHLEPDEIRDVGRYILGRFKFADDVEQSVEIDPRNMRRDHIAAFAEIGFNRTSFGVQDFDPQVQEAINRVQSEEITRQVVDWAREFGFKSVNLDLIYGLPYQSVDTFRTTVNKIIDISPDRIAVFNYAHVPWMKRHQKILGEQPMPVADERLAILEMTIQRLVDAGYEYIGMDHFAKPTDELAIAQKEGTLYRNFQGYSTKAGADVYAFGVSAISQFENIYAQNEKEIRKYFARIDAGRAATHVGYRMTQDDHIRKETIMQLMCNLEIDKGRVEREFGIEFDKYFAADLPKLDPFIADGLLEENDSHIRVVDSGILVIRNIAMAFDAYIEQMMREKPVFSKTV
ncbi:MAG TPA: oxygen-independent coproporphyrinogen III oxidase [Pyrinomonadaceae bacterium]|nr:oxygen-independent coproporphyrinogen III oxidase [Pyrinomonadaceae bacterium]